MLPRLVALLELARKCLRIEHGHDGVEAGRALTFVA